MPHFVCHLDRLQILACYLDIMGTCELREGICSKCAFGLCMCLSEIFQKERSCVRLSLVYLPCPCLSFVKGYVLRVFLVCPCAFLKCYKKEGSCARLSLLVYLPCPFLSFVKGHVPSVLLVCVCVFVQPFAPKYHSRSEGSQTSAPDNVSLV